MSNSSIYPPNKDFNGWFKYFPFESRSWKQVIANSTLPDEAKSLVRDVITKSHLMRFEKLEVVQELIGHFLDGQLAGQTYPQMLAGFGDPKIIATLIRRSKIRNRPIMFKIAQIIGWIFLGVFAIYLGIYAYFYSASPTPNNDYLSDLNVLNTGGDDSEKAWPIYRTAWNQFDFGENGRFNKNEIQTFFVSDHESDHDYQNERLIESSDEQWPEAVSKLAEITPLLDAFREGATKPRLGFEIQVDPNNYSDEDYFALFSTTKRDMPTNREEHPDPEIAKTSKGALIGILLPHLQQFRQAARLLVVDTRWAVEQGDSTRALKNIEAFIGIGSHASDSNVLIGSLVGFAVTGMGFNTLEEILEANPRFFDDEQLERLITRIGNTSFSDMTRIEGERASVLDLIQRVYSDDGNGNGRITAVGLRAGMFFTSAAHDSLMQETGNATSDRFFRFAQNAMAPASLFVVADRKETTELANRYIDTYRDAIDQPFWDREPLEIEDEIENNQMKHFIVASLLPAVDAVMNATDRMTGRQEGILTALAAHRFYLANGEWPTELVSLSPNYIDELPVDVVTGNELLITTDDMGPIIYSVGRDLDDDGGVQTVNQRGEMVPSSQWVGGSSTSGGNGDWIVWPQSRFDQRGFQQK